MITNGVNLVQWLDNLSSEPTRTISWLSNENLEMMRADGIETLRIPLDPVLLTNGTFNEWNPSLLAILEDRLAKMLEMGFTVILNAWKYGAGTPVMSEIILNNSRNGKGSLPATFAAYFHLFRELVSRYPEAIESGKLVVDIIDETGSNIKTKEGLAVKDALVAKSYTDTILDTILLLRGAKETANLAIDIPVHGWHAIESFRVIAPEFKEKLSHLPMLHVAVQQWEPWVITHASSVAHGLGGLTGLPWPLTEDSAAPILERLTAIGDVATADKLRAIIPSDFSTLDERMKMCKEISGLCGIPARLSGFGLIRAGCTEEAGNAYIRDMTKAANKHGIGWNIWQAYANIYGEETRPNKDYGIYDRVRWGGPDNFKLLRNPDRLAALDLWKEPVTPPEPPEPEPPSPSPPKQPQGCAFALLALVQSVGASFFFMSTRNR